MSILDEVRCPGCKRKLMELQGQAQIKCPKCKLLIHIDTDAREIYVKEERQR